MTRLLQRKTKLRFETEATIQRRTVIVEANPFYCTVRLKGTRKGLPVSWESVYYRAAEIEADRKRRERQAKKKARKEKP